MSATPGPGQTAETAEYWAGCARHELLLQHCTRCGALQFPPRTLCTSCSGDALGWTRASGRAVVISHALVRRPIAQAGAQASAPPAPYVLLMLRLAEGPTLMSTLAEASPDEVAVGLEVEVVFDDTAAGYTLPRFRPVR